MELSNHLLYFLVIPFIYIHKAKSLLPIIYGVSYVQVMALYLSEFAYLGILTVATQWIQRIFQFLK